MNELARAKELLGKITQGRWQIQVQSRFSSEEECYASGYISIVDEKGITVIGNWADFAGDSGLTITKQDAQYVAESPELMAALAKRLDEVEVAIQRIKNNRDEKHRYKLEPNLVEQRGFVYDEVLAILGEK